MIIWLGSYLKSGNTWLRLFMRAYRDGRLDISEPFPPDMKQDTSVEYYEAAAPGGTLDGLTRNQVKHLRPAALVHMAVEHDPLYLKTHCVKGIVDGSDTVPDDQTAKAVYIIRDPRDVAVSLADHLGVSIDEAITNMASSHWLVYRGKVIQFVSSWSLNVESWTKRDRPFDVIVGRYEDMVDKSELCFRNLIAFLGWEYDEERFALAHELTTFAALRAQEDDSGFARKSRHQEKFFRQGKAGAWQDVLTPEQAARIERDHGAAMIRHGYHVPLREVA